MNGNCRKWILGGIQYFGKTYTSLYNGSIGLSDGTGEGLISNMKDMRTTTCNLTSHKNSAIDLVKSIEVPERSTLRRIGLESDTKIALNNDIEKKTDFHDGQRSDQEV